MERLLGSSKSKTTNNKAALEEQVKQKLKGLVYDDELVNELLPVFVKLHATEGFDTVYELLEAKEKQIEAISGGDWFKQDSTPDKNTTDDEDNQEEDSVEQLLSNKYKQGK